MRSVYLEQVDIDDHAVLTLKVEGCTFYDYLHYFLYYGSLADKVIMQGSAPLKIVLIQNVFFTLIEGFRRDEFHNPYNPIFSFSLDKSYECYLDYNKARKSKLSHSMNNAELEAYKMSNSLNFASLMDKKLKFIGYHRRNASVSNSFKNGVLTDIDNLHFKNLDYGYKFKLRATNIANDLDVFQSFEYIKALNLHPQLIPLYYQFIRKNYFLANAYANNALTPSNSIHFNWSNINHLMRILDINTYFSNHINKSTIALFHLRMSKSFLKIKDTYFQCQTDYEIKLLFYLIEKLKNTNKFIVLLKHSPASLITFFFSSLDENDIGFKAFNKACLSLSKAVLNEYIDIKFSNNVHNLIQDLDSFFSELKHLNKILA